MRGLIGFALVAATLALGSAAPARAGCNGNTAWHDRFPAWSPTGGAIAFMRQQPGCDAPPESLGLVRPGSAEEIVGANGRRASNAPPSWDPNGLAVAFGTELGTIGVNAFGGPVGDDGAGAFPSWAGSSVAATVGTSLQLLELGADVRRTLIANYVKPTQSNGVAVWSPDGTRLALGVMLNFSEGGIAVVNADGSGFHVIAAGPNQSVNPTWSPDGRTIAFETNRDGNFEIYSARADGTEVRNLTRTPRGEDRLPAWKGNTIAFISNRDKAAATPYGYNLWTMSADGSNQRWRAEDMHPYSTVSWSPDGTQIAFSSGRECLRWGIYLLDVATDGVRRITNQCQFSGTERQDILNGTPFKDFIFGGGGNDYVYGLQGADLILGQAGNDTIDGGPGDDALSGGRGDDVVKGGDGHDRVTVDAPGHDRITTGRGDDRVVAVNRWRDVISCGPGHDSVLADRIDRVAADCERVARP